VTLGVALKVETVESPAVKFLVATAVTDTVSNATRLALAGLVAVAVTLVVKLLLSPATPDPVLAPSADTAAVVEVSAVDVLVLAPAAVIVATTVILELASLVAVALRTGVKK
jgi:hypothetical protein